MSKRFFVEIWCKRDLIEFRNTWQENEYLPNNELTTHDLFLSRRQKHYSYNSEGLTATTRGQPVLQRISAIDLLFHFLESSDAMLFCYSVSCPWLRRVGNDSIPLLHRGSAVERLWWEGSVIFNLLEGHIGIIFVAGKVSLVNCMYQKSKRCQSMQTKSLFTWQSCVNTQMRLLKCTWHASNDLHFSRLLLRA